MISLYVVALYIKKIKIGEESSQSLLCVFHVKISLEIFSLTWKEIRTINYISQYTHLKVTISTGQSQALRRHCYIHSNISEYLLETRL